MLPRVAAAAASVCFGATVVAVRSLADHTDPLTIALLRMVIGTLLFLPVVFFVPRARIPLRDLLPIAALGISMFGVLSYCSAGALQYIHAARGALILTTMPLFTLLLSSGFRQERLTALKLAGVAMTVVGVAVAFAGSPMGARAGAPMWVGDLFMFAASFAGALYNAFSPRYLRQYPALRVTLYSMIAGTVFLVVVAAPGGLVGRVVGFTPVVWATLVFIGAFGAAAGFFLWVWALQRLAPSRVVVFFSLNPLAATALAAWLLAEPVTPWFLLGLACVLGGIFLVNRERANVAPPALRTASGLP